MQDKSSVVYGLKRRSGVQSAIEYPGTGTGSLRVFDTGKGIDHIGGSKASAAVFEAGIGMKPDVTAEVKSIAESVVRDIPAAGNAGFDMQAVVELEDAVVKLIAGPDT